MLQFTTRKEVTKSVQFEILADTWWIPLFEVILSLLTWVWQGCGLRQGTQYSDILLVS